MDCAVGSLIGINSYRFVGMQLWAFSSNYTLNNWLRISKYLSLCISGRFSQSQSHMFFCYVLTRAAQHEDKEAFLANRFPIFLWYQYCNIISTLAILTLMLFQWLLMPIIGVEYWNRMDVEMLIMLVESYFFYSVMRPNMWFEKRAMCWQTYIAVPKYLEIDWEVSRFCINEPVR